MTVALEQMTHAVGNAISNLGLTNAQNGVSITPSNLDVNAMTQAANALIENGFQVAQNIGIA